MTLQGLKYFVSAAQLGNFTRAAQECHVTQPALSRAIAELEREMSCQLFLRGGKGLELTEAGRACLQEARRLLRQSDAMRERVWRAAEGRAGAISIGYIILGHLNLLNAHMLTFLKSHPLVEVKTVYDSALNAKKRLLSGELDVIMLPRPSISDLPPYEGVVLMKNGLNILVHRTHMLFERESVRLAELASQRFVLWDKEDLPLLFNAYVAACEGEGFQPNVVATAHKLGDMVAETAMKNAIGFVNRAVSYVETPDIRIIPVSDYPSGFDIMLVRLLEEENLHAAALLKYIASAVGQSVFRIDRKD